MPFEDSLNDANKILLEKLKAAGADISFEVDNTADSWYMLEKHSFKIASPDNNPNPSAMAHELLHVQLGIQGFNSTLDIYRHFNESNSVFTPDFIGTLNNNLAHFKMLDQFLEMGFNIDDFLQDTPKTYYLEGMLMSTALLVGKHNLGLIQPCSDTRGMIILCVGAKLFELYKIKDPNTQNGLHPSGVMDPLKEINAPLIEGLDGLFNDWNEANTVDNLQFYYRLNTMLHDLGIPNENDCK